MPDKARHYQGRRRGKRREVRRPGPQELTGASAPASAVSPQTAAIQPKPAAQFTSGTKPGVKPATEQMLKITPVKELKRIGIIAGSMFLILFILAFILK